MTDLEDVFGEDLADQVRKRTAERRQERNRVGEEQMKRIAAEAVSGNKFQGGDPMFQYTTENNVTHTVLLMQVPELRNGTVWEYLDEPWEGAASLPLDYLGEWMRCTFPDKNDLKKIDSGDWVMVVGSIDEYEKDNGEVIESVYPVRGIMTLEEVKQAAQEALSEQGFEPADEDIAESEPDSEKEAPSPDTIEQPPEGSSDDESSEPEEPEEEASKGESKPSWLDGDDDDEEEESSEESSSGSGGGLKDLMNEAEDEDEEEEEEAPTVPYDDIANLVHQLGDQEPAVWEVTADDARLDRLTEVVCTKLDLENEEATREVILDVISNHGDDDEEEEGEMDKLF